MPEHEVLRSGAISMLAQGIAPAATLAEIDAPAALAQAAERIRSIDRQQLTDALTRAGLMMPPDMHIELIPESDPRSADVPRWIVGLASGTRDIVIFPDRVGSPDSFPYDSLESVVWHEVVHLALAVQAGDGRLPRWFHEGVAMSVENGWGVTSDLQLLAAAVGNPDIRDLRRLFASDSQPETALGYRLAAALVADIRQRHGEAVPGAIAVRVAQGVPFVEAFFIQTGETPDEAAAQAWSSYRRWTSWIPALTSASSIWVAIMALAVMAFAVRLRKRTQRRRAWDEEEAARSAFAEASARDDDGDGTAGRSDPPYVH
ncbi:MAG: hypothetical protein ABL986_14045 [Vicinamibacterales bacterium]